MTCKDCIHYEVCGYHIDEETDMKIDDGVCEHFKDKSAFKMSNLNKAKTHDKTHIE